MQQRFVTFLARDASRRLSDRPALVVAMQMCQEGSTACGKQGMVRRCLPVAAAVASIECQVNGKVLSGCLQATGGITLSETAPERPKKSACCSS